MVIKMPYNKNYYERNREKIIARTREWKKRHPEKQREYYLKNREKKLDAVKRWMKNNRERWNNYCKQYLRTHCVTTVNGRIFGLKRPYPENGCELCNKVAKLHYHHYDDSNLMKGIWLCPSCHIFVERLEQNEGILERYYQLKKYVCECD